MSDESLLGLTLLSFALWATAHVMCAHGVLRRTHARRAVMGFLLVPLAPVFAWRARMRARAVVWALASVLYAVARGVALVRDT